MTELAKPDSSYGKMLLRRRSPYTSMTLAALAIAAIVLPYLASKADTDLELISVVIAGIPFPLFFAYSIAIRLEIFEGVVRVRKLWGTRVIPLPQLKSFSSQSASGSRSRLVFRPREGRDIRVTVEGESPDDELLAVLAEVAKHAPNQP